MQHQIKCQWLIRHNRTINVFSRVMRSSFIILFYFVRLFCFILFALSPFSCLSRPLVNNYLQKAFHHLTAQRPVCRNHRRTRVAIFHFFTGQREGERIPKAARFHENLEFAKALKACTNDIDSKSTLPQS